MAIQTDVLVKKNMSLNPATRRSSVIVTPEKSLLDELVEIRCRSFYGELGVLPGRTPLIGRLGYGELHDEGRSNRAPTSLTAASRKFATTWSRS